jgi:hypothetical protein
MSAHSNDMVCILDLFSAVVYNIIVVFDKRFSSKFFVSVNIFFFFFFGRFFLFFPYIAETTVQNKYCIFSIRRIDFLCENVLNIG